MQSRHKAYVYAAMLAVTILVWAADRALRSGPRGASAVEVRPAPQNLSSADRLHVPGADVPTFSVAPPAPSPAAQWLDDLPDVPQVRDLFASSNLFPPRTDSRDGETGATDKDPVAEFVGNHRLSATFRDDRGACALVDGRVLRPGHELDGFRLIRVESFRATFVRGDRQAALRLTPLEQASNRDAAQEQ